MKLILKTIDGTIQTFILGEKNLIGKGANCTVDMTGDDHVSRKHAAIIKKGKVYWLKDLDSNNGTSVNGEKITDAVKLKNDDQISIGKSVFSVQLESPSAALSGQDDKPTVGFTPDEGETQEIDDLLDEETQFMSKETIEYLFDESFQKIYVVGGIKEGESFLLENPETYIGRAASNDLCFPCSSISTRHAVISFNNYAYTIKDLDSKNGTFVNKKRLTEELLLSSGDKIQIGDVTLRFGDKDVAENSEDLPLSPKPKSKSFLFILIFVLLGAGGVFILKSVTTTKNQNDYSSSLTSNNQLIEEQFSGMELQRHAEDIIKDSIQMYMDGDIEKAIGHIETINTLSLANDDPKKIEGQKLANYIKECFSLYKKGNKSFLAGDIESSVETWNKVLLIEASFLDSSSGEKSFIARNIRRMMAEELYLQVIQFVEQKNILMAKQYCIEVLKAIPDHKGCQEIMKGSGNL